MNRPLILHLRRLLISGVFILVPFVVTLTVALWLFDWLRRLIRPLIVRLSAILMHAPKTNEIPPYALKIIVYCLAFAALVLIVYMMGTLGARVLGKRWIRAAETLLKRIPLAGTLYCTVKQVVGVFGTEDRPAYQSVVMLEFPRPGFMSLGFLTGYTTLTPDRRMARVFVPTSPNPTTGFFQLVPAAQVTETDLTLDEAFKMILSGGLISPEEISPAQMHEIES